MKNSIKNFTFIITIALCLIVVIGTYTAQDTYASEDEPRSYVYTSIDKDGEELSEIISENKVSSLHRSKTLLSASSEESGYTFSYNEATKTLTFSGTGMIESDLAIEANSPWHQYKDTAETLVIEDGIYGVGPFSFRDFKKLKNVQFPAEMSSLEQQAFSFCDAIEEVVFPDEITFMDAAFTYCDNLKKVTFGSLSDEAGSVICYKGNLFYECPALETIIVPEDNWLFSFKDGGLFHNGTALLCFPSGTPTEIYEVPDNTVEIWGYAFSDNDTLKEVIIPNSVKYTLNEVFSDCKALETLTFPESIEGFYRVVGEIGNITYELGACPWTWCHNLSTVINNSNATMAVANREWNNDTRMITYGKDKESGLFVDEIQQGSVEMTWVSGLSEGAEFIYNGRGFVVLTSYDPTCELLNSSEKIGGTVRCTDCYDFDKSPKYAEFGGLKYEIVEAGGHPNAGNMQVVKAATCTEDGLEQSYCILCNEVYETRTIPAFGHDYACEDGSCAVCGENPNHSNFIPTPTPETATIGKVKLSTASYVYNGKVKSPKVIVKDSNGNVLKKGTDYTVTTPKGRKNVGKYTYTIKFKGDYSGKKKLTLTIRPAKPTIKAPKSAKKAITVKWKKVSKQATGYQVMVATNKSFTKNVKKAFVTKSKTTSKKMTKLKAKTKYFVKVRTYKTVKVNGKNTKIYSNWSKVKTIRTK